MNTTLTTAQKIIACSATAADALELAITLDGDRDQDWENGKTTFTFLDGSKIWVSGPQFGSQP